MMLLKMLQGNMAEWSKALELGNYSLSSPKGREFEPHCCQMSDPTLMGSFFQSLFAARKVMITPKPQLFRHCSLGHRYQLR